MERGRTEYDVPESSGMPLLGLGTWQNEDHQQCVASVRMALETGYRHVDTAQAYRNETGVGEGLAAADVDREDVFLATKVWISNLAPADVRRTAEESLRKLDTGYVDLLYVHWPAGASDGDAPRVRRTQGRRPRRAHRRLELRAAPPGRGPGRPR